MPVKQEPLKKASYDSLEEWLMIKGFNSNEPPNNSTDGWPSIALGQQAIYNPAPSL